MGIEALIGFPKNITQDKYPIAITNEKNVIKNLDDSIAFYVYEYQR